MIEAEACVAILGPNFLDNTAAEPGHAIHRRENLLRGENIDTGTLPPRIQQYEQL